MSRSLFTHPLLKKRKTKKTYLLAFASSVRSAAESFLFGASPSMRLVLFWGFLARTTIRGKMCVKNLTHPHLRNRPFGVNPEFFLSGTKTKSDTFLFLSNRGDLSFATGQNGGFGFFQGLQFSWILFFLIL